MSQYPYSYDDMLYKLHVTKSAEDNYTKINLPAINVSRKNKLSIISNFFAYSEKLNRKKEDIADFFKRETGVANSINNQDQLIIQGNFNETKCETIMKNYIKQFVMCKQCKGLNSVLVKEDGLTYMECKQCLAKTSMGKI
ncbi:MAG: hypothetical protein Satyrvirus2_30 [Satyrvirus sp.]|uniref:Translation initiation factor IF2/IF5 domain-containing protein n=1 Tax=Satyrvirus sp. TaxID=2487771 RepID=A0A3G5AHY6_9VIRU|nr:MAG: hypothetical protein Satyrvirus2_30 [Satyrvirus sp.]